MLNLRGKQSAVFAFRVHIKPHRMSMRVVYRLLNDNLFHVQAQILQNRAQHILNRRHVVLKAPGHGHIVEQTCLFRLFGAQLPVFIDKLFGMSGVITSSWVVV